MHRFKQLLWAVGTFGLVLAAELATAQNPAVVTSTAAPTLVFDAELKEYHARTGELIAPFVFNLTNVWTNEIIIRSVHTSCGCTAASLPANPWRLAPGDHGQVHATVNLKDKMGVIEKALTFDTTVGERVASLRVIIPPPPEILAPSMTDAERTKAMTMAGADARAIFQGDCITCHVTPAEHKKGADLYAAACGICHDSPHRASLVPDLHALKNPGDYNYWKQIINLGKPHTMMPGFAQSVGGPLTDQQIASLASYLNRTITHHAPRSATANLASTPVVQPALTQ